MNARLIAKIELIVGAVLTLSAIVGFLFIVVLNLPRASQVAENSRPLPKIPEKFFSPENPVMAKIGQLVVPSGVPVKVEPGNLGRENVFKNY
ncbi:MAG: hypothetical protein AAB499_01720 [Patescibacteria group bacterium]